MLLTKKDYTIIIGLFLLALLLRLPKLSYPTQALFDESTEATFATYILHQQPYFTVHPPLSSLVNAVSVKSYQPSLQIENTSQTINKFPYQTARQLNAFLGAGLVIAVYLIARALSMATWQAVIAAWLVIWDNSLVVYSRLMLPENLLLFLGFGGLALFLIGGSARSKKIRYLLFICGAALLGGALSVKWIALGFIAVLGWWLWRQQRLREFALALLFILFIHLTIWVIYFASIGGVNSKTPISLGKIQTVSERLKYPPGNDLVGIVRYLPTLFVTMFKANSNYSEHANSSQPQQWLVGEKKLGILVENDRAIIVQGNPVGWFSVIIALVVALLLSILSLTNRVLRDDNRTLLLLAFFISYIPFFFINRVFFIYHYFPALIFGYLLVPLIWPSVKDWCIRNTYWQKRLLPAYLYIVVISFLLLAPTTYGLILPW
ncbi:MAG: phospholipid carrier-dependent glycosyltransferase [Patescibacteria group bacterium]